MGDTPCKMLTSLHVLDLDPLHTYHMNKEEIDNVDVLLSAISMNVTRLSYEGHSVVSCMSQAGGDHRLHLFNCQMDIRVENAADMILHISKVRDIACKNAIFSYRQQIQVSTLGHGGMPCMVPEETLADHVLQTHQDIIACLYIDSSDKMTFKYKSTEDRDEHFELFFKELDFICRIVSRQPETLEMPH